MRITMHLYTFCNWAALVNNFNQQRYQTWLQRSAILSTTTFQCANRKSTYSRVGFHVRQSIQDGIIIQFLHCNTSWSAKCNCTNAQTRSIVVFTTGADVLLACGIVRWQKFSGRHEVSAKLCSQKIPVYVKFVDSWTLHVNIFLANQISKKPHTILLVYPLWLVRCNAFFSTRL